MASKILVVDDETPVRTLLRCAVSAPEFTVLEADGGARALEVAAREAPFALVVTDVLMPGMDGFELAEELCRAGQADRFLFISGYCDVGSVASRMEAFPRAAFLSKPFPIADLMRAVHGLLEPAEVETSRPELNDARRCA